MCRVLFVSGFLCFYSLLNAQPTLYFNGKVLTSDTSAPLASYFVVENGTVIKVGRDLGEIKVNDYPRQFDLQAKTVIPGIIDSHIHFIDGGLGLLQVSFFTVTTRNEFIEKIRSTQSSLIDGMYIGRDLGNIPLMDVDLPLKLLDELMPETPTIIFMKSGHAAIANSAAMRRLGFNNKTSLPDGSIEKDSAGNLTGFLLEGAAMEASRILSANYSNETIQRAILQMQTLAFSYGIVMIGDNTFNPYYYKIYQELQKQGLLKIRIRARSYGRLPQTEGLMKGVGRKHLGFIGGGVDPSVVNYHAMKFFEDQSLSPDPNRKGAMAPGGRVFLDEGELNDIFQLNPGSTFAFHVQGKEGLQHILNAVKANEPTVVHHRHVIDHMGYASPQQVEEAAKLGLGVTILGGQLFDYNFLSAYYKAHDLQEIHFDERDLLDARLKVKVANAALTSDYPYGMDTLFTNYNQIDGLNPFPILAVNITGKFPDGSVIAGVEDKTLSIEEALKAYTTNGAYVLNEERSYGKIAPGYHADFIVMQNPLPSDDAFSYYNARVSATYINGERVYDEAVSDIAPIPKVKKVSPSDYAISPVIGYDPTLGMILGAAYFKFPLKIPGRYFDIQFQTITGGKINVQSTYTQFELFRNMNLTLSGSYSDFFQYYFGEGNSTDAANYTKLFANTYRIRPELTLKLRKNYQVSAYGDVRGRNETKATDKNDNNLNQTYFPTENTVAFGLSLVQDSRDNAFSTKKGTLKQVSIQFIPSSWNVAGLGSVTQMTAEIRHFRYIGNSNFVLATRLAGGLSSGSPSYLFRYSIGGPYALRGYYTNRFRGEKYYVGQLEARFPLYKLFSGAAFVDAGEVTDKDFGRLRYTYGAGLRVALSQNIKLRLDYGKAKDQNGVFFTFSEAF